MRIASFLPPALAVLSLCAHASPLPSTYTPPSALLKRQSASASALQSTTEAAISSTPKSDWKRPVVITTSAIGLAMTVGWNYISAKSFLSNREKFYKEKARMEAEKKKPPPKVGDTVCTVETYTTSDQVEGRKPSLVKTPCYVLGQRGEGQGQQEGGGRDGDAQVASMSSGDGGDDVVGGVSESQQQGDLSSDFESGARDRIPKRFPVTSSTASAPSAFDPSRDYSANAATGNIVISHPLHKRGLSSPQPITAVDEIVEEAIPTHPSFPSLSSSSSSSSIHSPEYIPLLPLDSNHRLRPRPSFPPSTFESTSSPPSSDLRKELKPNLSSDKYKAWVQKLKSSGEKLSTDDITFGLTVLNTLGNIPSLIMTTINARYYRGNPKVD
ncbi:hypothetical protein PHSY_004494 [Pseudozyma hubeiensis SY62]|uniref:Uncharacterized protein n=1 Tax=Pseudozyma hubeiensis (strain SY62) TaxID=1305764 RepID=R9PFR0_PSEHS|nr:hypothetical protein PHSY_004494 [Pseudozyma hubeiensis SY62]GAC96910.1 hypothetical protein PHSY_004494 [Pseudozyma hubeiensis SY62]